MMPFVLIKEGMAMGPATVLLVLSRSWWEKKVYKRGDWIDPWTRREVTTCLLPLRIP